MTSNADLTVTGGGGDNHSRKRVTSGDLDRMDAAGQEDPR